jgi:hypothetical protein
MPRPQELKPFRILKRKQEKRKQDPADTPESKKGSIPLISCRE